MPDSNHTRDSLPDIPDLTGKPLEIKSARDCDSVTIALSGELDLASVEGLARAIRDYEETDIGEIVVDLSDLSFTDSAGLHLLLDARKRIDGRLHFVPSKHETVTRVLAITHTDEILN